MIRCPATATLVLVLFCAVSAIGQSEIMPVDQVRPGMTGVIKTTLRGTAVEDVSAEVLGVMRNAFGPNFHLVLVRLTDERVQYQGVANGMSGSPLYIDGKLVGALSTRLGWFAKEPIAGVTPIGDMLAVQFGGRGKPQVSLDYNRLWSGNAAVERLARLLGRSLRSAVKPPRGADLPMGMSPLTPTLSHSGLDPEIIRRYAPFFREVGVDVLTAGSLSGGPVRIQGSLRPGMPVAVELLGGDLYLGASGTLTYLDGDKLWAFGHPFFQLGQVDWPLARAEIVKVFPSMQGSFNITNTGQVIGAITQDRAPAVFGELGRSARTIPMDVEVKHGGSEVAKYSYRLIRDTLLTPALIDIAISQSLLVTQKQAGEMSVEISSSFSLEGYEELKIENLFTGINISSEVGALPAAVYYFLSDNEFKPVEVSSISVTLNFVGEQKIAELQRAWFTKSSEVKPGDRFKLVMELKPRRGKPFSLEQNYFIPPTLQVGTYKVTVGNGAAIARQEEELIQGTFRIRDVGHMIRLINSLRPNFKLYVQVYREEEGIYYEGDFFPGLPPSALSVMKANKGDDNFVRLLGTVMDERRMETEYYVEGVRKLQFVVKR